MKIKNKDELKLNQRLFTTTSLISVACLIGCFGNPLEKLTVYRQDEQGLMGEIRQDTYIITESSRDFPYGFNQEIAYPVAQVREDYKFQKLLLLACSLVSATYALAIADEVIKDSDIIEQVKELEQTAQKELLIKKVKLNAAALAKEQLLNFSNQLQGLYGSYGQDAPEYQYQEADELAATDKSFQVMEMVNSGHSIEYAVSKIYDLPEDSEECRKVAQSYIED